MGKTQQMFFIHYQKEHLFSPTGTKRQILSLKSGRNAQAKMLRFHFYSGPSVPFPSRGFGHPVRSRGHTNDKSNYA